MKEYKNKKPAHVLHEQAFCFCIGRDDDYCLRAASWANNSFSLAVRLVGS